jgi:RES domain
MSPTPNNGRRPLAPSLLLQTPRLVWRVHAARYGAAVFHPGGHGNARFSPIVSRSGIHVPTLYLASTLEGALMESVFREVPTPPGEYILDLGRLRDAQLVVSCLRIDRRLRLVDLSTKGLKRLGLTRREVVDTSVLEYANTRAFSERMHQTTQAQGLVWTSKQDDGAKAYLLFGDRISAIALRVVEDRASLLEEPHLTSLITLATRIGVTRVYSG